MKKKVIIIVAVVVVVVSAVCLAVFVDWTGSSADVRTGVTDAKTPISEEQAELKFKAVVKQADSWDANSNILVVGDYIYVGSGAEIKKLDKSGAEISTATLTGSMSSFAPSIAYSDGMIFAYVNDFTNGYIEAVDSETMQRVWVSEGIEGMNGFSPITINDNNLYIGVSGYDFENYVSTAGYVIGMTISDDDTGSQDEIKANTFLYDGGFSYYWNGIAINENIAIVGSVEGVLQTIDTKTGVLINEYKAGEKIASSITYVDGKAYFGTSANFGAEGGLVRIDIEKDGSIVETSMQICELGAQTTTTPIVSDGRIYVGTGDFLGGAGFYVIDAAAMTSIYSAQISGIDSWTGEDIAVAGVQSTPILTTAYSDTYLYFAINAKPGGIIMLKDAKGQTTADITEIFAPDEADQNSTSASFVADEDGTIYFTNDSGFLFAVGTQG